MKEQSSSDSVLPLIFMSFGLVALGYLTFMGLNYISNGNLVIAGVVTLCVLVIFYILSDRLAHRKGYKYSMKERNKSQTTEKILWMVYLLFFMGVFFINTHSLVIDFVKKSDMQQAGRLKAQSFADLYEEYTTALKTKQNDFETSAKTYLMDAKTKNDYSGLDSLFGKSVFSKANKANLEPNFNKALKDKKDNLFKRLKLDTDFENNTTKYIEASKNVFKDWQIFKTAYTYDEIELKKQEFYKKAKEKMSDFATNKISADQPNIFRDYTASIKEAGPIVLLICLAGLLVIHLCLLAPVLATTRYVGPAGPMQHTKSGKSLKKD